MVGRTMSEYIPIPREWVAAQVKLYERRGCAEGIPLRDRSLPVKIVNNRGRKTEVARQTPLMRTGSDRGKSRQETKPNASSWSS